MRRKEGDGKAVCGHQGDVAAIFFTEIAALPCACDRSLYFLAFANRVLFFLSNGKSTIFFAGHTVVAEICVWTWLLMSNDGTFGFYHVGIDIQSMIQQQSMQMLSSSDQPTRSICDPSIFVCSVSAVDVQRLPTPFHYCLPSLIIIGLMPFPM